MAKEEGFFTVAEDETTNEKEEEIMSIVEEGWDDVEFMPTSWQEDEVFVEKQQKAEDQSWLSSGKSEHFVSFLKQELERIPKRVVSKADS
jgi:hypothetical protein